MHEIVQSNRRRSAKPFPSHVVRSKRMRDPPPRGVSSTRLRVPSGVRQKFVVRIDLAAADMRADRREVGQAVYGRASAVSA